MAATIHEGNTLARLHFVMSVANLFTLLLTEFR